MHYVCTLEIDTSYIGGLRECGYGSGERSMGSQQAYRTRFRHVGYPHHGAVHSQHLPLGAVGSAGYPPRRRRCRRSFVAAVAVRRAAERVSRRP